MSVKIETMIMPMSANRGIQPTFDPHFHYASPPQALHHAVNTGRDEPFINNIALNPHMPNDDGRSFNFERRYSSPQMGYYDLITGEYRYRSDSQYNQSPLLSNYAGETEPPMCENSCKWCEVKVPFNCLTICLITSMMLLMMFALFNMILSTKPRNAANMALFRDMIWLMSTSTFIFMSLIVLRYTCFKHRSTLCAPCANCELINVIRGESGSHSNLHLKQTNLRRSSGSGVGGSGESRAIQKSEMNPDFV